MKTKEFISVLLYNCKTAESINNKSDYTRVKKWVNKATVMYLLFTVIGVALSLAINFAASAVSDATDGAVSGAPAPLVLTVGVLTAWGFVTMCMNLKLMLSSLLNSGSKGYRIGETVQTKHVDVTHEYGNTYKVSTYTDNQGCVLAMIYGFINLFVWAFLCVYICPFLTFKKILDSRKKLSTFKA